LAQLSISTQKGEKIMAWNIQALILMGLGLVCFYLGIHTERGAWKQSNKALRKEIQNN
jgi:hypothetical protein